MINFKDSKDQTPSALAVIGMLLIAGAVVVSLFFNGGMDARQYAVKARKDAEDLRQRSLVAKSDNFLYKETIDRYQWKEPEDVVTPSALTIVSKRAEENKLNLVNFRPLKSVENSSMIQLPLQFTVDGSFASVAAMLESLEKSDSKLTIQQVQFASQEGETDLVTASVSLLAYLAKPTTSKTKPKETTAISSTKPATKVTP